MILDSEWLLERLTALGAGIPATRYLLAFSGGMDSTVLLHALSHVPDVDRDSILAIHVDHGLHASSGDWTEHCRQVACQLGVQSMSRRVTIDQGSGSSLEASAREARYVALREEMRPGDWLLSAHHADDQAETLLLGLMRGSGPAGIAGIARVQRFGPGQLLRPLLDVPRDAIADYASRHGLDWIDDPGNENLRFDRNFLRQDILPRLNARWPSLAARLGQSARLASECDGLLRDLADLDIARAGSAARLDLAAVRGLGSERQRNLIRRAVSLCGLLPPPSGCLDQAVHELIPAREDAQPLVAWQGAELRRYRDRLFVLPALAVPSAAPLQNLRPDTSLSLGTALGALQLCADVEDGIDPQLVAAGLLVRFRQGGEKIRPTGHECTHTLKKLLQQQGIVPWMRPRLPLLYAGDRLVAVANLWIAADCSRRLGYGVRWSDAPPLD